MYRNNSVSIMVKDQQEKLPPVLKIKKKVQYDQVSQASSVKTERKEKLNQDLRSRLKVAWRKIYRAILKIDIEKKGKIATAKFG